MLRRLQRSCRRANSFGGITAPVGLLGELAMTILVFGVMACSTCEARKMKKSSARVGAKTGVPPAYFTDVRVADPIGSADDHFIAGIDERADGVEDGVLAADVYHALGRLVGRFEILRVPIANRLAEGCDARDWSVLGAVFFERLHDGALDVIGRGEIGFAGAEVGDVHALGFQLFGFLQHDHCGRDVDAIDAIGELEGFFHLFLGGQFHGTPSSFCQQNK